MNLNYCGGTHICGRSLNEDAFDMQQINDNLALFVVADGLGGHAAGEVASRLAVPALIDSVRTHAPSEGSFSQVQMREILTTGFIAAARAIADDCWANENHTVMATTLLAVLINDTLDCVVAYVGDSRAYLGGRDLKRITKDHSFVQELFERGLITEDAMQLHPMRNIVTRVVGAVPVNPDFVDLSLEKNTLLLCTDGLYGALTDEEIFLEIQGKDVPRICQNLVERSRAINRDNTTVIVVRA
jgi:protein phosphatase